VQTTVRKEPIDGELVLRDSPWDPYTTLLPMHEMLSAALVWTRTVSREITLAGPLDPIGFWPYADTIGGSRWPGLRGGPNFQD
jgi:acetoacetate decarboxylase